MVYHYTNFSFETNAWWIRRVRPVKFEKSIKFIRHSHWLAVYILYGLDTDIIFLEKMHLDGIGRSQRRKGNREQSLTKGLRLVGFINITEIGDIIRFISQL